MKNQISLVAMVAIAIIAIGGWFTPAGQAVQDTFGGTTNYDALDVTDGYSVDGTTVIDGSGNIDAPVTSTTGTFSSTLDVTGAVTVGSIVQPVTSVSTTTTLTAANFGETIYLTAASGTTATLPAATSGAFIRFVIATAFDTANMVIDSAEGDNIEGTLLVAGAVVDCDAEDQINFVNDGENLGDFVELSSDGTNWYIGASGALTAAKLTCTDPS